MSISGKLAPQNAHCHVTNTNLVILNSRLSSAGLVVYENMGVASNNDSPRFLTIITAKLSSRRSLISCFLFWISVPVVAYIAYGTFTFLRSIISSMVRSDELGKCMALFCDV